MAPVYYKGIDVTKSQLGRGIAYLGIPTDASVPLDPDAEAFLTATGITDGTITSAINTLVVDLKDNSLWNLMDLIYPFVTDNPTTIGTQLSYNLKNTAQFQATLVNGAGDSDSGGYKADASATRYINTNYNVRTNRGNTGPIHVSIYTSTAGETGDVWDFGGFTSNSDYLYMITGRSLSGGNTGKLFGVPNSVASVTSAQSAGYYLGRYDAAATPRNTYTLNGSQIASNTTAISGALFNGNAFFGAANFGGSPTNRSSKKYQLLSVGGNLSTSQISTLNTIVQNFQTTLGRQV